MKLLEVALEALVFAKALCEETNQTGTNCYASAIDAIAAIESYAESIEPVAHVVTHKTGGNAGLAKHIEWLPHSQSVMPGDMLYLHPQAPGGESCACMESMGEGQQCDSLFKSAELLKALGAASQENE
jgi:hypothetical protein